MLKVGIILILGLAAMTEARQFGKPPFQRPEKYVNCYSDSLPALSDQFQKAAEKCEVEAQVETVLAKFQPDNQVLARSLIGELKSLTSDLYRDATSRVISYHPDLLTQLQQVDPNGYNAFNALIASAGSSQTCEQSVAAMQSYVSSLNTQGEAVSRKINCWVISDVKQNSRVAMGQFVFQNMDSFAKLKTQEAANFQELMSLFKGQMKP